MKPLFASACSPIQFASFQHPLLFRLMLRSDEMRTNIAALGVILTGIFQTATSVPHAFRRAQSVVPTDSIVHQELGPKLSKGASIFLPGSAQFTNVTVRWSSFTTPKYAFVVVPAFTEDVAAAVGISAAFASVSRVDKFFRSNSPVNTTFIPGGEPGPRNSSHDIKRQKRCQNLRACIEQHPGGSRRPVRATGWWHLR